jgi:hypothetical protein
LSNDTNETPCVRALELGYCLEATLLHQVQQLEGGTGWPFLANLPFLDGGQTRVQQSSENRLADVRALANVLDLRRPQRLDRWQAQSVEFAHRDLLDHAGLAQPFGRLVDGLKNR